LDDRRRIPSSSATLHTYLPLRLVLEVEIAEHLPIGVTEPQRTLSPSDEANDSSDSCAGRPRRVGQAHEAVGARRPADRDPPRSAGALDPRSATSTPQGELLVTILAGFATFERHLIKLRTDDRTTDHAAI
jgi:hypothetical protein